jgi:hypothetical protein
MCHLKRSKETGGIIMQKKAFLIIFFFILAFFVGGLTGLAAAYFVTGSGTKAVPAQVQPTSESGPSFLEEASPSVQQEKNVLASGGEELISHSAPTIEVIEERNPDLEQKEEKEKKLAYLTIDDGPDPENTPALLEILRSSEPRWKNIQIFWKKYAKKDTQWATIPITMSIKRSTPMMRLF